MVEITAPGGSGELEVGTTLIVGGTNAYLLYNNNGVLGEEDATLLFYPLSTNPAGYLTASTNLFTRTLTVLSPTTAGDSLDMGTGAILTTGTLGAGAITGTSLSAGVGSILGGSERITDNTTFNAIMLANPNLTGGTSWARTNDCTLTANEARWAFNNGLASNLTQTSVNFVAGLAKPNRWYRFTYTVSNSAGNPTANATGLFTSAIAVNANGTFSIDVLTNTVLNFVITSTLTAGQSFTLDTFSLAEYIGGGLYVNGNLTANRGYFSQGNGQPPFVVNSSNVVLNLNAQYLQGYQYNNLPYGANPMTSDLNANNFNINNIGTTYKTEFGDLGVGQNFAWWNTGVTGTKGRMIFRAGLENLWAVNIDGNDNVDNGTYGTIKLSQLYGVGYFNGPGLIIQTAQPGNDWYYNVNAYFLCNGLNSFNDPTNQNDGYGRSLFGEFVVNDDGINAVQIGGNNAIATIAFHGGLPTSDPGDGTNSLWADPITHIVYLGT